MKISILLFFLCSAVFAKSNVRYIQSQNHKIIEIPEGDMESVCGANFVFREQGKNNLPNYLRKEAIKAAFKGQMAPSLEVMITLLLSSNGKCGWLIEGENPKELIVK